MKVSADLFLSALPIQLLRLPLTFYKIAAPFCAFDLNRRFQRLTHKIWLPSTCGFARNRSSGRLRSNKDLLTAFPAAAKASWISAGAAGFASFRQTRELDSESGALVQTGAGCDQPPTVRQHEATCDG